MADQEFYSVYRERIENKLRHKNVQIARTERLLQTLPPEQRASFEGLLDEETAHRNELQRELDELFRLLEEQKKAL